MATLTIKPATQDASVRYGLSGMYSGYNYGTSTMWTVQTVTDTPFLILFDCSSIPTGASCNGASLYFTCNNSTLVASLNIWAIASGNANWPEGTHAGATGGASDCCWNYKEQGSLIPWAGACGLAASGIDYETPIIGYLILEKNAGSGAVFSCTLTASRVAGWFGATNTNYGMKCTPKADTSHVVHTSQTASPSYAPSLVVDYTAPVTGKPGIFSTLSGIRGLSAITGYCYPLI